MPTIEERVAYLEGKVEEHSRGFSELRDMIIHLDQKVDRFREELSSRLDRLDARLDATNSRVDNLEARLNARLDALDAKFSRYFLWTIGIQITVLLAIIGALLRT